MKLDTDAEIVCINILLICSVNVEKIKFESNA